MELRKKIVGISRWDSYSLGIISLAVILQLLKWNLLPIFVDIYYHLLTASGFREAGGWIHSCFWEYAPVGRPQLYPPLLHIIILFFLKLGVPFLVVGKLIQVTIYPLVLLTVWYFIRSTFDKRQAFFVTLLVFSPYSFYLTTVNASAASLSLIFCLLSLLFFEKNKIATSALFLGISFYTHGHTSWIFLGVFILYGIFNRAKLIACIKVALIAICLASPFIIFQFINRTYFLFQRNIVENYYIELNLLNWLLFPFGLIACIRKKGKYLIFIALFISSLIFLFNGLVFRYLSFYGIMGIACMNALFLKDLFSASNRKRKVILFVIILLLCIIFSPTLNIDLSKSKISRVSKEFLFGERGSPLRKGQLVTLDYLDSNLINSILYCAKSNIRSNEISIYSKHLFKEINDVVMANTEKDDIIYSNFAPLGGIISLLSNRATSSAMLSEIKPYSPFDKIAVAKLVIWTKDLQDMEEEPFNLIKDYGLRKIADTKIAFIYENPNSYLKKKTLSAAVSYKFLLVLVFLVLMLAIWSIKFGIDK